jgi:hypothetical protein
MIADAAGVTFFPSPLVGEGGAKRRMRGFFLSIDLNPSPVSNSLRSFEPPSPTRGEGKRRAATRMSNARHAQALTMTVVSV